MNLDSPRTVKYLWDRFYHASIICTAPGPSVAVVKGNNVYRYFPQEDSLSDISPSSSSINLRDISGTQNCLWAITNFNQVSKWDTAGWHFAYALGGSFNPSRILALNDSVIVLTDGTDVRTYGPGGLSGSLYTFNPAVGASAIEWAADTAGRAWIAAGSKFMSVSPDTVAFYLPSLPGYEYVTHVATDAYGGIYATTSGGNLYVTHTNYFTLQNHQYSFNALAVDRYGAIGAAVAADTAMILNTTAGDHAFFGNMPYQHIQAVTGGLIATDQGIFQLTNNYYYMNNVLPTNFMDSSDQIYAHDVTCFGTGDNSGSTYYGTHHGLYRMYSSIPAVTTALLPDSNINCVYNHNGTLIIGTDKGLCVTDQLFYTTYDTSNSPLPSNKITFVTFDYESYTSQQELWIGTDKGLALYAAGVWTIYDTTVIPVPSMYVTGVQPNLYYYMNYDTSIWVSTLGSGLIKIKRHGGYTVFNTGNQQLQDDSLYYLTGTPGCYSYGSMIIGTAHHGICTYDRNNTNTFLYDTAANPYYGNGQSAKFSSSKLFYQSDASYIGTTMLVTDNGIDFVGRCVVEGIKEVTLLNGKLTWHQSNSNTVHVSIDGYDGDAEYTIYDMQGKQLGVTTAHGATDIDVRNLATGAYILEGRHDGITARCEAIIMR